MLEGGSFTEFNFSNFINEHLQLQCPPLNWITSGQTKSDNINRMIQLTEEAFLLKILEK